MVQVNKWLFGSLHLCLTEEERKAKLAARQLEHYEKFQAPYCEPPEKKP